ncbi:MAG TPA: glycosyltransferase [Aldersonia sp.]
MNPSRIVVVVPACNEADALPECLSSLRVARVRVDTPVRIVVVLDDPTDGSETAAHAADDVVTVRCRNVGAARAAGFAHAGGSDPATLFVSTDADCEVEPNWLQRHLTHACAGARVVCGTVAVRDWSHLGPRTRARFDAGYRTHTGHGHIHGANLAVRAGDYWASGGFAALPSGEDVELIRRLQHRRVPITWAADLAVWTAARLHGRAPRGFADHLRSLHDAEARIR